MALGAFEKVGVTGDKGYFVPPTLLVNEAPEPAKAVHEHEVFGPVSSLLPYGDTASLVGDVQKGGGGLVCSVYSDDRAFVTDVVFGIAPFHGRVLGSEDDRGPDAGPGTVLPSMSTAAPGARAAARSWAGGAGSPSICSGRRSRGPGRCWTRCSG